MRNWSISPFVIPSPGCAVSGSITIATREERFLPVLLLLGQWRGGETFVRLLAIIGGPVHQVGRDAERLLWI